MRLKYTTLFFGVLFAFGCTKESSQKPQKSLLQIEQNSISNGLQLSNLSGIVYSAVTITGNIFDTTKANNIVKFNGVTAIVNSASPTQLVATVPSQATTGKVTVTVGGETYTTANDFKVLHAVKEGSLIVPFRPDILVFDRSGNGTGYASDGMNIYKMAANAPGSKIFSLPPNPFQTYPNHHIQAFTTDNNGNIYAIISTTGFINLENTIQPLNYDCVIEKITPTGQTSVVLGRDVKDPNQTYVDGNYKTATFVNAHKIITDENGSNLYIEDSGALRKIDGKGSVTTVLKAGYINENNNVMAKFTNNDIAIINGFAVKKISTANGMVSIVAGGAPKGLFDEQSDGQGIMATFAAYQYSIATDGNNNLFVSEERHDEHPGTVIRMVNTANYVSTLSDTGLPSYTTIFTDKSTGKIYLVSGNTITRYSYK